MPRRSRPKVAQKYYEKMRKQNRSLPDGMLYLLLRQGYAVVGEHSAAKLCHWAAKSLKGEGECYKSRFYGISSHRCLQCTPVLQFCNHACRFCWRIMPEKDKYGNPSSFSWEEPAGIVDGLLAAQRKLVYGFGGNPKVAESRLAEALRPAHAAISLTGEPAMYPMIGGLIGEFKKRKMTTFLVTNGTFPEAVKACEELPTQLYVSMVAPDKSTYEMHIRPLSDSLWEKYWQTLRNLPSIGERTRTVLRMTLARDINDKNLEGYANQILTAKPHYVEVKSMVYVGGARGKERGLSLQSMLKMEEVREIAGRLSRITGYTYEDEHAPSRVALLCRDGEASKNRRIRWP